MKKKRTEKRRPTDEEMSRAADTKLKRYITKSALEWADRDPEIRSQMVAQTFGYKLPDQAEKKQRELIAYIDELAIHSPGKTLAHSQGCPGKNVRCCRIKE